jgi:hypothetical protein
MAMSRRLRILFGVILVAALTAAPAAAAKPSYTCPAAASGFERLDADGWWDSTVELFVENGIEVYEADGVTFTAEFEAWVQAAGFASAAELEFFVTVIQWAGLDANGNGYACMQPLPTTPGLPFFIVNGLDDAASVP